MGNARSNFNFLQAASELYGKAVKALEAEGKAGMSSDVFRHAFLSKMALSDPACLLRDQRKV